MRNALLSTLALLLMLSFAACDSDTGDSSPDPGTDVVSGDVATAADILAEEDVASVEDVMPVEDVPTVEDVAAVEDLATVEDLAAAEDTTQAAGVGVVVSFSIHNSAGAQVLDLTEMVAKDDDGGVWDVMVSKSAAGPVILLGEETLGLDLGAEAGFDDVDEVPADGYLADTEEASVIGQSWMDGGVGETGFTMTGNLYALYRPELGYAKMTVLSAVAGTIEVLLYFQADGSTWVATEGDR